jgi:hypothetical protein
MSKSQLRRTVNRVRLEMDAMYSDAVRACAAELQFHFRFPPTSTYEQTARLAGLRGTIERSGLAGGDVRRALALALETYFAQYPDVILTTADIEQAISRYSVDGVLACMALPVEWRSAYLRGEPIPYPMPHPAPDVPLEADSSPAEAQAPDHGSLRPMPLRPRRRAAPVVEWP